MQSERNIFARELIVSLQKIYTEIDELSVYIEGCSKKIYQSIFEQDKGAILQEVEKYQANIKIIKELNSRRTDQINNWYKFTNNQHEVGKIVFPIKFYVYGFQLKKKMSKFNQQIYDLTVENRLIRENISKWEQETEVKAIQEIKNSKEYKRYSKLLASKKRYIADLKYLLPTILKRTTLKVKVGDFDLFVKKYL